jgi:signal transduction histidine kinase
MDGLADATGALWPLGLTLATVGVVARVRTTRRREGLNQALHELRRPLQALLLGRSHSNGAAGQIEMALAALAQLDAEINGGARRGRPCRARLSDLVVGAAERWHGAAAIAGRSLEVACCERVEILGEPARLAQAVDNLIANALEHGRGGIRIAGAIHGRAVRITVVDAGRDPAVAGPSVGRARGVRRGHGLRLAAAVAAEHGGRIEILRSTAGTTVALELPAARG